MSKIQQYLDSGITFAPVAVGYMMQGDRVLLGLRKKVSLGLGQNLIAGIGGKVGDEEAFANETNAEALVREIKEEICVNVTKFEERGRIRFIFPTNSKWNFILTAYIVTEWQGEPVETDVIKPLWFDRDNLPFDRMWDDTKYYVSKLLNGEKIDAIFLYGDDEKTVEEYEM